MRQHPRTIIAAALAAGLAIGALSACSDSPGGGGAGDGDPNRVLEYWVWQDDATDPTWTDMVDQFNAQSTIGKVELVTIPLAQYEDKLLNGLASGGGPDAARFRDLWLGEFVEAGAVENLDDEIAGWDGKGDIADFLYDTGKVPGDDAVYMMPHQYSTNYMYYRKSIFTAAGLEPPATHDDVIHAAEVLAQRGQYALDVRGGAGGQDQWSAWLLSGGAQFANAAGDITLAQTGTEINQQYIDFVTNGYAPPGSTTADFAAIKTNFFNGTTAMMIHHAGSYNAVVQALGDDFGVVPMPQADPENPVTFGIMSGNVIMSASDKKDLAWAWVSFLDTHDPMLKLSTSVQGQLPVLTSVIQESAFQDNPALRIAIEAQSYAKSWPLFPGASKVANKEWGPTMQAAFEGTMTSNEALTHLGGVLAGK